MTTTLNQAEVSADDYCIFGLATCFVREEGDIKEVEVIEPIPSAYWETLLKGVETSYKFVCAKTVGEVLVNDSLQKPNDFPSNSQFCHNFTEMTLAATRTYKKKPSAKEFLALGEQKADLNYSLARKRILNNIKTVSDDDNVKQHPNTHKIL
ncbi:hypothetical protein A5482_001540 [Cyanobacterium sp. IPPAS B-1200]|uniref:hypothetical protein n=1 Tax=Cyanobacterium sp. IPPAS B-1200 TaxID=1562720 RepID=UPI0008525A3D|nr:hypothetical protein [Cyanobacterium sp. IPPAS B-1200]OEJ77711.1 hypothetical protein A5482_15285 [Cyanobacterium sp. IPPAS B-1200]